MMTIGLISDTHGVFDQPFKDFLEGVDELWHAGDWGGSLDFPESVRSFKKTVGVVGNCDSRVLLSDFPLHLAFEREGVKVLMTHIGGYPGKYDPKARKLIQELRPQLFVCGHSHILKVMWDEKYQMLTVNPGAAGIQGWQLVRTALRFRIEAGKIKDMEVFNYGKS